MENGDFVDKDVLPTTEEGLDKIELGLGPFKEELPEKFFYIETYSHGSKFKRTKDQLEVVAITPEDLDDYLKQENEIIECYDDLEHLIFSFLKPETDLERINWIRTGKKTKEIYEFRGEIFYECPEEFTPEAEYKK